ncbi:MAG: ATP-binding protein [Elusimicrobiota bacterium]|nr:ATP-binding protein [Elusimicrobiota bacterium]
MTPPRRGRHAAPAREPRRAPEHGAKRIGTLYEISKLLTHFVSTTEEVVRALLAIMTKELPLRSAVLIEKAGERPAKIVWHAPEFSPSELEAAEARARTSFDYLTRTAAPEPESIVPGTGAAAPPPSDAPRPDPGKFLSLPLIVQGRPVFGVLHLEGEAPFDEADLAFASAISNQLAITIERFHARLKELEMRRRAEAGEKSARRELSLRRGVESEVRALNADLERRVAERTAQFQETIRELHAFTYSIAHDLRAPLRHIHGFSDLLLGTADERTLQSYVSRIKAASEGMDVLINDLLAYSRLTLEDVKLEPVSLSEILAGVRSELKGELESRGGFLEAADPLPRVQGHKVQLKQAVYNLVSNALKFTAPGVAPRVSVTAEERDGRVRLWVRDNGIGIAPEHQERIFGVFQRLHGVEAYPGTGIGLAIVRRALERMKGSSGVESRPGEGSRFWIELPKEQVPA